MGTEAKARGAGGKATAPAPIQVQNTTNEQLTKFLRTRDIHELCETKTNCKKKGRSRWVLVTKIYIPIFCLVRLSILNVGT